MKLDNEVRLLRWYSIYNNVLKDAPQIPKPTMSSGYLVAFCMWGFEATEERSLWINIKTQLDIDIAMLKKIEKIYIIWSWL